MPISAALGSSALLPAGLGFRNKIINGGFDINQRAFTSATADATFGFDRWQLAVSGGTTYTPQTFTLGNTISNQEPTNYARLVTTGQSGASVASILSQKIEDVRTCAGQQVTVSFWAKASSGTPKIAIELTQNFGTGGSPSTEVENYFGQVTLSTSWARYVVTGLVPSIVGKTLGSASSYLRFVVWVSAGTNYNSRTGSIGIQSNTFDIWGVQLEQNYQPTPFEQRPIGVELELCQRYYQRMVDPVGAGVSQGSGGGSARVTVPFYTKMRAAPTSTMSGTLNFYNGVSTVTATSIAATHNSFSHGQFDFPATFATVGQAIIMYTTGGSQYIDFSSEL